MNEQLSLLEPREVWGNFAALNAVPRPSKKEERVIQFMLNFGKSLHLETFRDAVGNVIIRKVATLGMENRQTVTLQSHLDMVHQKNTETEFDFDTEGIRMKVENDWVKAEGTTLGADNGLGVAAIMALLESTTVPHPALEALFTIDEETGMTGAMGLKAGVLKGTILLNLDTEEDDEIDIGCAGGIDVTASRSYTEETVSDGFIGYRIIVKGLQGGHSGIEIHKGLANANKLMNRLLFKSTANHGLRIAALDGGGLRNAIPRESFAEVVLEAGKAADLERDFTSWAAILKAEFADKEPGMKLILESIETPKKVMGITVQEQLLRAIHTAHNGVHAMSTTMQDLVETSNNIARVEVKEGKITVGCLTRSSVDAAKMELANSLKAVFESGDFEVGFGGNYPGWNPNPDSAILRVLETQYEHLFQTSPKVVACHAGLECGILGRNYPLMDMISFGPTIKGAHSPDERASITSVQKFWKFLLNILKAYTGKRRGNLKN